MSDPVPEITEPTYADALDDIEALERLWDMTDAARHGNYLFREHHADALKSHYAKGHEPKPAAMRHPARQVMLRFAQEHFGKDIFDRDAWCRLKRWLSGQMLLGEHEVDRLPLSEVERFLRGCQQQQSQKQQAGRRTGRPKKTAKDSATLVVAALSKWHGYDNGSVTNHEAATNRGLAEEYDLSGNALARFLKDRFPQEAKPAKKYAAACGNRTIGHLLALWNRELPGRMPGLTAADAEPDRPEEAE